MRTNAELLDLVEERMIGWTWDCRVQLLAYVLSRIDNLPREMEVQKNLLSQLQFRVEYYARLRMALEGVTTHQTVLKIEGPDQAWSMNGALPHSAETDSRPHIVNRLVEEIKRLEDDFCRNPVDFDGICRFLRKALQA